MRTRAVIMGVVLGALTFGCTQKTEAPPPEAPSEAAAAAPAPPASAPAKPAAPPASAPAKPAAAPGPTAEDDHDHAHHHAHGKPGAGLHLNNGTKWEMDEHTRGALAALEALAKGGPKTDDPPGHKALGKALDEGLQALIRGCTMKGPAHEMLHVWLTRMIPAVGGLAHTDTGDLGELQARLTEIEELIAKARLHFR